MNEYEFIVDILRYAPKGLKLWFKDHEVEFMYIEEETDMIVIKDPNYQDRATVAVWDNSATCFEYLIKDLFPNKYSKDWSDWYKYLLKPGDIISSPRFIMKYWHTKNDSPVADYAFVRAGEIGPPFYFTDCRFASREEVEQLNESFYKEYKPNRTIGGYYLAKYETD